MKNIVLIFNQLSNANGVARCAVSIANILSQRNDTNVTLLPLYKSDKKIESTLNPKIRVKACFNHYFPGFAKFLELIPGKFLYKKILSNDYYDIVIAFQYGIATYIVGSMKSVNNQKKMIWVHCYDENVKYRKEYLNVDKVVCVSKCNKERLENDLNVKGHVDYCYNPINDIIISEQGKESISLKPNKNFQFVTVGRLAKVKGFDRLIDCIYKLISNGHDCSLWIIGPGTELNTLRNKIKELNLENNVILVGAQSNPHRFTSKADIFVCSSYIEGYSTACTEAILLGVPVITTPVSGAHEIIEEAQCGMISKDFETDSLYEIMETVVTNPQMVEEWKETLKKTRIAFTQASRIEKLYKVLGL